MADQPKPNPGEPERSPPEKKDPNVGNEDPGDSAVAGSTEHSPSRQQQTKDSVDEKSSPLREKLSTPPSTPPRNPNLTSTVTKSPILKARLESPIKTPQYRWQGSLFGNVPSATPVKRETSEQFIRQHPITSSLLNQPSQSSESPEAAKTTDSETCGMPKDSKQSDGKGVEESGKQSQSNGTTGASNSEAPSSAVTEASAQSDAVPDDTTHPSTVASLKRELTQPTSSADSNPAKMKRARCSDTISGIDAVPELSELMEMKEEDSDAEERSGKSDTD